jgi:hypothetical protein
MLLALFLQQAAPDASETAFDRMPTWEKYGILACIVVVAVSMIETIRRSGHRDREVKMAALAAGCRFNATDPAGLGDITFAAFARAKGTRVTNVVSAKTDNGVVVRAFDFSTYIEQTSNYRQSESEFGDYLWGVDGWGETGRSSSTAAKLYAKARSGAVVKVDAFLPPMMIVPSNLLTRTFEKVAAPDIDFESEEFNRGYDVRCTDRRFASLFLDARMIDFILDFDRHFAFETFGNYVLCHGKICEAKRLPVLAAKMGDLAALVNPLVADEYPTVAGIEYRAAISDWNHRPGGAGGVY